MKNFLLLLILSSFSFIGKSQVVTGVYKGKMVSDSLKYSVDFELTLKEKNGELYGYCQRLFLIDNVLYYNLVKVKARIKDSVLIVEDEKSVSNNFEQKTKGIKTVYMFNIKDIIDTASVLNGEWSTSSWRNLYAIPGKLVVNRERNYLATQLYKRLEEKRLSKEMLFDEPKPILVSTPTKPQPTDIVSTKPDEKPTITTSTTNKPDVKPSKDSVIATTVAVTKPEEIKPKPNDVVVNQTATTKPTTTPVQNKPVVTVKDSINKTSVAVNNSQQPTTKPNDAAVNKPTSKPPVTNTTQNQPSIASNNKPVVTIPVDSTNKSSVAVNKPQQTKPQPTTVAVNQPNTKPPVTTQQQNQPTTTTNKPTTNNPVVTTTQQQPKPQQTNPAVTTTKPTNTTTTNPQQNTSTATNKPADVVVNQPTLPTINPVGNTVVGTTTGQPQTTPGKPPVINNPVIVKRQVEIIEALEVTEDSVVLSLYDNGEIDGDTVSVFLNNELIVSKIGIKASAYKKTIAVKSGEIIQLTLFAENLGSIPPNTGLLIISTTNERYQVNFSSTLNKSSSIVLKRKE
jgi:hypothetical protein